MLAFEYSEHKAFIVNNEDGCKIADALRNKLRSENKSFKESQDKNVIYFSWLETKRWNAN